MPCMCMDMHWSGRLHSMVKIMHAMQVFPVALQAQCKYSQLLSKRMACEPIHINVAF